MTTTKCEKHPAAGKLRSGQCATCKVVADQVIYHAARLRQGKELPAGVGEEVRAGLIARGALSPVGATPMQPKPAVDVESDPFATEEVGEPEPAAEYKTAPKRAKDRDELADRMSGLRTATGGLVKVALPGGSEYVSRQLGESSDVTALQRLRAAGLPLLMSGPPGAGKTSLCMAAFPDCEILAGTASTTADDFLGQWAQRPDGTYEWHDGPLTRALKAGAPFFADDCTLIDPRVLAVVYPVMDGRGSVQMVTDEGTVTVRAATGFYVIGGHNPGAHGAILTPALASRFSVHLAVASDYDMAREMGLDPKAVKVAANMAAKVTERTASWAPQYRELLAYERIKGALGETAALANLMGACPEGDRATLATVASTVFGKPVAATGVLELGPAVREVKDK